jgi:hypothetical protein
MTALQARTAQPLGGDHDRSRTYQRSIGCSVLLSIARKNRKASGRSVFLQQKRFIGWDDK